MKHKKTPLTYADKIIQGKKLSKDNPIMELRNRLHAKKVVSSKSE